MIIGLMIGVYGIFSVQAFRHSDSIETKSSHPDQAVVNHRTGKLERVFVNLEAVYPNVNDPSVEMSFDELRALKRGWLHRDWKAESRTTLQDTSGNAQPQVQANGRKRVREDPVNVTLTVDLKDKLVIDDDSITRSQDLTDMAKEGAREGKIGKPRTLKVREIKAETQTGKLRATSEVVG